MTNLKGLLAKWRQSSDAPPALESDDNFAKVALMRDRLNAVSQSFCLAKWKQVTLNLHNGFTQSCHHVKSHKIPLEDLRENPSGLHNTGVKAAARQQMLNGVRPKECSYCWTLEDMGRFSDRHYKSANDWAENYFDEIKSAGAGADVIPTSVEVSFESTCNFMCMYCSPQFSSKWMEETLKFGRYPVREGSPNVDGLASQGRIPIAKNQTNPYIEAFWQWWPALKPRLHDFRITGGEPLLSPHTWRVMEELGQSSQINLHFAINSNMGVSSATVDKLVERINGLAGRIKHFTLYTSIDTVGDQAEYIRFGLNYRNYLENVERVLSEVKWPIQVSFMMTVNALSIVGMEALLRKVHELRVKYPDKICFVDAPILHMPPHMSVRILPTAFSQYVEHAVRFMQSTVGKPGGFDMWEILRVDRVLTAMRSDRLKGRELRQLRADFYRMFVEYDRRRGTDFFSTFPEYKKFYELCRRHAWMSEPRQWVKILAERAAPRR